MLKRNQTSTNCIPSSQFIRFFFCYEFKSWMKICPKKSKFLVTFDLIQDVKDIMKALNKTKLKGVQFGKILDLILPPVRGVDGDFFCNM